MPIETTDIFKHCAPAIRTNIGKCGTVTLCNATSPATLDELDTLFKDGSDWRILEALFSAQMESKACGAVQNSLEDFFLANLRKVKRSEVQLDSQTRTLTKIRPFILSKQRRPINNVYWRVSGGTSAETNWQVDVQSASGIPSDVRSFTAGERVYIKSVRSGGTLNRWQGVVVTSTLVGDVVRLVLDPQNDGGSFENVENPVTGILERGSVNIGKTEEFCDNEPGYIDSNMVEYWLEHTKMTLCNTESFKEFREFILKNNPLYANFYDLPEVEENRQRTKAFWSKWFNNLMYSDAISPYQNLNQYNLLPQVTNFTSAITGLGIGGGACDGFKANTIGWLPQLNRCDRIKDLQGAQLDLWSLMDEIYNMHRVRIGVGSAAATSFDLFTDGTTADLIERGFIRLFKAYSEDTMRMNMEITSGKNEEFGFAYRKFLLKGKTTGITLNVITHFGLDDYLSEWNDFGNEDAGRFIWLLDMTGIYASILESTQRDSTSGRWEDLVKVDPRMQCVEETKTRDVRQIGVTYAAVVECPASHLVLHGFSSEIPEHVLSDSRPNYGSNAVEVTYY